MKIVSLLDFLNVSYFCLVNNYRRLKRHETETETETETSDLGEGRKKVKKTPPQSMTGFFLLLTLLLEK